MVRAKPTKQEATFLKKSAARARTKPRAPKPLPMAAKKVIAHVGAAAVVVVVAAAVVIAIATKSSPEANRAASRARNQVCRAM
jgi:hypothetical protein